MTPLAALLLFALPALVAAIALLAAGARSAKLSDLTPDPSAESEPPRPAPGAFRRMIPAAAVALAFWPADIAQNQWHDLWPKNGTQRYLAIALAAAVLALVHAAINRRPASALLRALIAGAIVPALLLPIPAEYVPRWLIAALAVAAALWLPALGLALDRAEARLPRPSLPAALLATAAAAAPGVAMSTHVDGAIFIGALASIAAGLLAATLLRPRATPPLAPALTVWLAIFVAILLVTYGYQPVPAWGALVLIALAPLGALAGFIPSRGWARVVAASTASALIAGAATGIVFASLPDAESSAESGY